MRPREGGTASSPPRLLDREVAARIPTSRECPPSRLVVFSTHEDLPMNALHIAVLALSATTFRGQQSTLQTASSSRQGATPGTTASTRTPMSPLVFGPCDVIDDGSSENGLGLAAPTGTDVLWMQRQGDVGQSTVVFSISTCWGTPAFSGSGPADGSTARYGIWQDNDNDGDPTTGLSLVAGPLSAVRAGGGGAPPT